VAGGIPGHGPPRASASGMSKPQANKSN
jgi:hypothetical protein